MSDGAERKANARGPATATALVVLAAALGAIAAAYFGALHGLSGDAHDALIKLRNQGRPAPASVVVVDIDPLTAQQQSDLPLKRSVYAKAIDRLTDLGVRAIAVDVQFTEASDDPRADEALLVAIEDTPVPVILGTSQVKRGGDTDVLGGRRNLEPAGAVAAHTGLVVDGERVRELDPIVEGLPSFAQATANAVGRPGLPHRGTLIDPTAPAWRLNRVSMQRLLDGTSRAAEFRGRIAVIGVSVVSPTGDDRIGVTGTPVVVPGVFAQAQAIDTALRGEPLRDGTELPSYFLALLVGVITALAARRALSVQLALAVGSLVGVGAVVAVGATQFDWLIDPVPAVVALVVSALGAMAVRAESERRRRAAARATLGRFVPPGVVDDLLDSDRDGLIAPRAQEATVVFCDLRGYTSLVASLEHPEALIAILDAYLSAVTETVHRHGGTVVSFQGDGVMSAFGTPVPTDEAPAQAVAAARELQARALPQVRRELASIVDGAEDLKLGVGVATGHVFAGTVGPAERREYAVVGPTTNLAARLQALTKTEGVDVVLDDATASRAGAPASARAHTGIVTANDGGLRSLGPREVRGLSAPVDVWTLADPGDAPPAAPAP